MSPCEKMLLRQLKWSKARTLVSSRSGFVSFLPFSSSVTLGKFPHHVMGERVEGDRNGRRGTSQELLSQDGRGEMTKRKALAPLCLLAHGKHPKCHS